MTSLRAVLRHVKRYKLPLALTILSMLILVGVQLAAPWLVRTMIAAVTSPSAGPQTLTEVAHLALIALAVYIVRALMQFVRSYEAHVAGWHVVADVRNEVYQHLQRLSLRFYEDKQTGQLMSRMVNDSDLLEQLVAHAIPDVLVNVLMLIGVTAVLASMSWRLALFSLLPIPLIILAMRGFARYVRPAFRRRQAQLGELNAILNDNISGIREIQAFTREESEGDRIWQRIVHYRDSLLHALRLMAVFHPSVEFTAALGTIILIYFGGRLMLGGTLGVADLVAFFLYLDLLYQPVRALSGVWENVQQSLAGADRIAELLEQEPDVAQRPDAIDLPGRAEGAIRFNDVSFRYSAGDMVLQNIDLDVAPGTVVALVGPTGVGKTTLSMLIPRFYDVTDGSITLGRPRHPRPDAREPAAPDQYRPAGGLPVPRHGRREHPLRASRRVGARDEGRGADRQCARVHRGSPRRLRDADRRARGQALRWPAAAARYRAGGAQGRADPDPRRGDLLGRYGDGNADPAGAGAADGRPHDRGDRSPSIYDSQRRSDCCSAGGADRRAGYA